MKNIKKAFTFTELIVVIIILGILSTIGVTSYIGYIADSRDSQRKSDLAQYSSALKVYKQKRGYFPTPGENFNITYSGTTVAYQGLLDTNVRLNTLDKLSFDPKTKEPYFYSVVTNKQEYEIVATLENEENNIAITNGSYKSVSKNILPSIVLAINETAGANVEIKDGTGSGTENRNKFILNKQEHNLAYTFVEPYEAYSDGTDISTIISELETTKDFWQNSDYRSCLEIEEAGKLLLPLSTDPVEYQIITETGALVNTGCTQ